ncbi:hypothetical protein HGRIS_006505 [Hohenbuehelia grisea]|uniref:Uncharacterized protein n=1 Tax=Hohenbuehelia grisea TaxID=104357 RepID=A0ABR3J9P9_9AGAR
MLEALPALSQLLCYSRPPSTSRQQNMARGRPSLRRFPRQAIVKGQSDFLPLRSNLRLIQLRAMSLHLSLPINLPFSNATPTPTHSASSETLFQISSPTLTFPGSCIFLHQLIPYAMQTSDDAELAAHVSGVEKRR